MVPGGNYGRRDRKPDRPRADGARRRHDLHSVVLDVQCRGHLHHLRRNPSGSLYSDQGQGISGGQAEKEQGAGQ